MLTLLTIPLGMLAALFWLLSWWLGRPRGANPQRWRRIRWIAGVSWALCVLVFIDTAPRPLLDDGPFHGEIVAQPSGLPSQQFPVGSRFVLLVYPVWSGQVDPIVCLVRGTDPSRPPRWCRAVTGSGSGTVHWVEFRGHGTAAWNVVVDGMASWTFGTEGARWIFTPWGHLRGYWFSW